LVAIFLFVPETDYDRKYITSETLPKGEMKDSADITETTEITETEPSSNGETKGPKKTFWQELKPWSRINPNASYIHLLLRPLPLVFYPAVFFSFIIFSTTLSWIVCYVDTAASVYQAPPYLMNIGVSGLYNVCAIICIPFGAFVGGALTDWVGQKMARRNNGVFEPEFRLITLIVPFFVVPMGLLMYPLCFMF
jgi:hypothetical protein